MGTNDRSIWGRIVDNQPTNQPAKRCTGGLELDGRLIDIGWHDWDGPDKGTHWPDGDCGWLLLDHPELCDQCVRSLGVVTSGHSVDSFVCTLGVSNNCQSMETTMMDQLLGTTWWSLLCVLSGIGLGVYLRPWIMSKLGK